MLTVIMRTIGATKAQIVPLSFDSQQLKEIIIIAHTKFPTYYRIFPFSSLVT